MTLDWRQHGRCYHAKLRDDRDAVVDEMGRWFYAMIQDGGVTIYLGTYRRLRGAMRCCEREATKRGWV